MASPCRYHVLRTGAGKVRKLKKIISYVSFCILPNCHNVIECAAFGRVAGPGASNEKMLPLLLTALGSAAAAAPLAGSKPNILVLFAGAPASAPPASSDLPADVPMCPA